MNRIPVIVPIVSPAGPGRLDASLRHQVLNLVGASEGDAAVSQPSICLRRSPAL